jgi:hypothetical protein
VALLFYHIRENAFSLMHWANGKLQLKQKASPGKRTKPKLRGTTSIRLAQHRQADGLQTRSAADVFIRLRVNGRSRAVLLSDDFFGSDSGRHSAQELLRRLPALGGVSMLVVSTRFAARPPA